MLKSLQEIQDNIKTLFKLYRKLKCKNCIESTSFVENNKTYTGLNWINGKKIYVKVYIENFTLPDNGVPILTRIYPTYENIDEILPMSKSYVKINAFGEERYYEAEGVLQEVSELPYEYNTVYIQPNNILYNLKNNNDSEIKVTSVVYFTEL